jgi:hypothetical protein
MSEDLKFVISVLLSSGIVSFFGWLMKKRIAVGIENSIKSKYDNKIENLKSELSISQSILTNSLANQTEGIKVTHEKRLKAIDFIWEDILKLQEFIQPLNYFDPITLGSEIERINKIKSDLPEEFKETISQAFKDLKSDKMLITATVHKKEIEKLRPYIGEKLWLLRYFYFAFIGRIVHLYENDYNKGLNLKHWMKDEFLKKNLENILSNDEIKFIYQSENGGIDRGINMFKQKILKEISEITSGISIGKSSLENAILLSKKMNE